MTSRDIILQIEPGANRGSRNQQELAQVTDQYVVSDLRAADQRAGHWVDDDPSLDTIRRWIQLHH